MSVLDNNSHNQNDFTSWDEFGKIHARKILLNYRCLLIDNQDKFGIDQLIYNFEGQFIGYADPTVKVDWTSDLFPYPTIDLAFSKVEKYSKLDKPMRNFIVSQDGSRMLSISSKKVKSAEVITKDCKRKDGTIEKDRKFYRFPKTWCKLLRHEI